MFTSLIASEVQPVLKKQGTTVTEITQYQCDLCHDKHDSFDEAKGCCEDEIIQYACAHCEGVFESEVRAFECHWYLTDLQLRPCDRQIFMQMVGREGFDAAKKLWNEGYRV